MLVCGSVLAAGLAGLLPPTIVFIVFVLGRAVYGGWGSASPPAVQAYVAARTEGEERTNALAAIASSFGLGTIIGPALAPLFLFRSEERRVGNECVSTCRSRWSPNT